MNVPLANTTVSITVSTLLEGSSVDVPKVIRGKEIIYVKVITAEFCLYFQRIYCSTESVLLK